MSSYYSQRPSSPPRAPSSVVPSHSQAQPGASWPPPSPPSQHHPETSAYPASYYSHGAYDASYSRDRAGYPPQPAPAGDRGLESAPYESSRHRYDDRGQAPPAPAYADPYPGRPYSVPAMPPAPLPTNRPGYPPYDGGAAPPDPYPRSRDPYRQHSYRSGESRRSPPPFAANNAGQSRGYYSSSQQPSFSSSNQYRRDDQRHERQYSSGGVPSMSASYPPPSPTRGSDPYYRSRNRQRSVSPDRRAKYGHGPDQGHQSSSFRSSRSNHPESREHAPRGSSNQGGNYRPKPVPAVVGGPSDQPQALQPLTYHVPEPAKEIRAEDFVNDAPLPVFPIRPPQQLRTPLSATYAETEAQKSGTDLVRDSENRKIRDPARDIVDRKALTRKHPPKIGRNPADPLDDVPLPPSVGPTTGSTPGRGRLSKREAEVSLERTVKRMREGEDGDEEHRGGSAKKIHLDLSSSQVSSSSSSTGSRLFARPSETIASEATPAGDGNLPENLLRIVEDTLAQIRGSGRSGNGRGDSQQKGADEGAADTTDAANSEK
ncbi:hypothetical protein BZA70DRAFT_283966 [Myxozyma melibiosi]|uniref:Uncharacterized protein n=1 Tax=Myxozyma melibiosi TaxID=54550 RepID=A0ABR1EZW4_9ASCO